MSELELNEDRDEFEVLEDFVYNGGNNNNNSKRIVKEVNEALYALVTKIKLELFGDVNISLAVLSKW
jgi:hypothetical protein